MKIQNLKNTNVDLVIDQVVDEIQTKIDKGSENLKNAALRAEIDDALKRNKYHEQPSQLNANELMIELTKYLIKTWPNPRGWAFQPVEESLKPLKEIAVVLNSEEVEKFIHVRDNPCVMIESRIPLGTFKKVLWERLFVN